MAELRDKFDVFRRISEDSLNSLEAQTMSGLKRFIRKQLDKYQARYPFMQNVTALEYLQHAVGQSAERQLQELKDPVPSDLQFWKAVFDYDPFKLAPGTHSDLFKYLRMKNLDSVPLGMYGGYAKLKLIRRMGALPDTETGKTVSKLKFAATDSGAISYPDAHPSELEDLEDEGFQVQDSQDQRLRRFTSLGSVIHVQSNGSWGYTGHALVVDMGHGRGRQPWFVLASQWERETENVEGSFFDRAPAEVDINDSNQPGVLPGGQNRTVVGMVEPMRKSNLHILRQFGPDFQFLVRREPPDRAYYPDPTRGPDLAYIMSWYWDPVREVEVCYYKDGREYMAYDLKTKYYTYTSFKIHRHSVAGESGMFGPLAAIKTGEDMSIEERMEPPMQEGSILHGGMSSSATTY